MAKANKIGPFSFRSTSATFLPGPGGSVITQVNFEGEATSFGTVGLTLAFVGANSGTFSGAGRAYLDNGDSLTGTADTGTFESVGPNRWKTSSIWRISDGSALLSEGVINLAERSWTGENYEWR